MSLDQLLYGDSEAILERRKTEMDANENLYQTLKLGDYVIRTTEPVIFGMVRDIIRQNMDAMVDIWSMDDRAYQINIGDLRRPTEAEIFLHMSGAMDQTKIEIGGMIHGQGNKEETPNGAIRESARGRGRFDLLSYEALEALALWSELGAEKYAERNWEKGLSVKDCINRMIRHALKAGNGWTDEDHLAAVMWNAGAAITMIQRRPDCNDHPWANHRPSNVYYIHPEKPDWKKANPALCDALSIGDRVQCISKPGREFEAVVTDFLSGGDYHHIKITDKFGTHFYVREQDLRRVPQSRGTRAHMMCVDEFASEEERRALELGRAIHEGFEEGLRQIQATGDLPGIDSRAFITGLKLAEEAEQTLILMAQAESRRTGKTFVEVLGELTGHLMNKPTVEEPKTIEEAMELAEKKGWVLYRCPACQAEVYLTPETPRHAIRIPRKKVAELEVFICPSCMNGIPIAKHDSKFMNHIKKRRENQ